MADTKIEWADKVWNPVTGCSKVSQGCKYCYAERLANRFWGKRKFTDVICHEDRLEEPLKWRKPALVFVNSMSDLFHDDVPLGFINRVWTKMIESPQHTYMVLTKRPKRMLHVLGNYAIQPNIWLGVSCEDQRAADERVPLLLQTPAAVRFVSCEPLLGKINLYWLRGEEKSDSVGRKYNKALNGMEQLDWVIVGGESGPGARPMHQDWVRHLLDQCLGYGVPFFFKQWGEWMPAGQGIAENVKKEQLHHFDDWSVSARVGKKAAGRLLDGREWNEFPKGCE